MVPSVYMSEDEEIDDRVKKTMRRVANPSNDDTSTVQETVIHEGFAVSISVCVCVYRH
jgi:hypothetical protein